VHFVHRDTDNGDAGADADQALLRVAGVTGPAAAPAGGGIAADVHGARTLTAESAAG
jgi:hypothetical protein